MIELNLVGVRVELPTNQPIVLLREREGERYLPIWIGAMEATAIAFALQGIVTARPITHDLMRNVLAEVEVRVERIVITEASIVIKDDEEQEVQKFREFLDQVTPEDFLPGGEV